MKKIALTTNEMQRLQELGVNTSTASMIWVSYYESLSMGDTKADLRVRNADIESVCECVPTFTLQDILEELPKYIKIDEEDGEYHYDLNSDMHDTICYCGGWAEYEGDYDDDVFLLHT